jgi:LysM repeat protein
MTQSHILLGTLAIALASCAGQKDDYDVNSPYGTPYGPADGGALQPVEPVNPVYDTPAVYEDTGIAATPPPITPAAPPAAPSRPANVHTVVKGDTLWGLSRQYNVSVDAIKAANNMTRDTVVLGTRLQIPAR